MSYIIYKKLRQGTILHWLPVIGANLVEFVQGFSKSLQELILLQKKMFMEVYFKDF